MSAGAQDHARISLLAKSTTITARLAFVKEDLHTLGHVDPQEPVQISDECSQRSQDDRFHDSMVGQVFSTKGRHLEVELDHESAVQTLWFRVSYRSVRCAQLTHAEETDQEISRYFKVMPVPIVCDLEQDEFAGTKWVH